MAKRDPNLSEVEEVLLGSIQVIFEIILSAEILQPEAIERMLVPMRNRFAAIKKDDAAAAVEILRRFVTDPKRAKIRAQRRKLRDDEPTGSA